MWRAPSDTRAQMGIKINCRGCKTCPGLCNCKMNNVLAMLLQSIHHSRGCNLCFLQLAWTYSIVLFLYGNWDTQTYHKLCAFIQNLCYATPFIRVNCLINTDSRLSTLFCRHAPFYRLNQTLQYPGRIQMLVTCETQWRKPSQNLSFRLPRVLSYLGLLAKVTKLCAFTTFIHPLRILVS